MSGRVQPQGARARSDGSRAAVLIQWVILVLSAGVGCDRGAASAERPAVEAHGGGGREGRPRVGLRESAGRRG